MGANLRLRHASADLLHDVGLAAVKLARVFGEGQTQLLADHHRPVPELEDVLHELLAQRIAIRLGELVDVVSGGVRAGEMLLDFGVSGGAFWETGYLRIFARMEFAAKK